MGRREAHGGYCCGILQAKGRLVAMRGTSVWGNRRKVILLICLVLVASVVLFEIGVRLLPADAVQYEVQGSNNGDSVITRTGTITDSVAVARWRDDVTGSQSGQFLIGTLIAQSREEITCSTLGYYSASYVFLWHGLPIESVSSLGTCDEQYMISRGGLPDLQTHYVEHLVQP
jgi:hypothetical protein